MCIFYLIYFYRVYIFIIFIFIIISIQFKAQSFVEFIPNYKKKYYISQSFIPNNDYIINDLKRQLNDERIKNQNLINENNNLKIHINSLKNNINYLNIQITNYINKIKSLENQLNNNNSFNNYQNNLNYNQMNSYIKASSVKPGEKILAVNFVSNGFQDIGHYCLPCKNTDIFVRLEEKLNNDYPTLKDQETYFIVNGRKIKRFKTLDENNIKSNDIINVFLADAEN